MKSAVAISLLLLLNISAKADVYIDDDCWGWPSAIDFQSWIDDFNHGKISDPKNTVDLIKGQHLSGPFESRYILWGDKNTEYVLLETPQGKRFWTLASWVVEISSPDQIPIIKRPKDLSDSPVWFARYLRGRFKKQLPFYGSTHELNSLPCLPKDITHFNFDVFVDGGALQVQGDLKLDAIPEPFSAMDGRNGETYTVILQAYLFAPSGILMWEKYGVPIGNPSIASDGGHLRYRLVNEYNHPLFGYELMIIAVGELILSDRQETRAVLGAKKMVLP